MRPVTAYHLIITCYGFWLPNDPRGSWSNFVRAWELVQFGRATKTTERRSLARDPHDRQLRREAKRHLARSPVRFSGLQARAVARGFADYVRRSGLIVYASVVMPDHAHLVIARHRYSIEQISNLLKGAASRQLVTEELHPFKDSAYRDGTLPTPWARGLWKCFLSDDESIRRAIRYAEDNPIHIGQKRQSWKFVTPFVDPNPA